MVYDNGGEYGHLFMQDTILPATHTNPVVMARYEQFGKRVHWIDANNMPGAFQMNTSWWYKPNKELLSQPGSMAGKPHSHPFPEILGFYGSDPEHPFDLGGEVELYVNGELHVITKSTMVFLPPNLPHCPIFVRKVDRPIFHFSVVMNSLYTAEHTDDKPFEAK